MNAARTDIAREALFVSDADVARMCRMTAAEWDVARVRLERAGFPQPDPVVGRYWWPAIVAFFDKRHVAAHQSSMPVTAPDGEEHWR